jgi:putative PEP-CTERM system TPR-repeat lipoprotein
MLAAMKVKAGADPGSVTGLLEKAIQADPADPLARVALIDHLTALGERRQAITVAQTALTALPDAAEILDSQGRLFMANGNPEQALANFTRLAAKSPRSAKAYLQMADAQIASGKVTSANDSVRRAVELEPDALPVQRAAIGLAMREKKPAQALDLARKVQRQRPRDATGFIFEGDIAAAQQQWPAAEAAYRAALTRPNPGTAAMRLHLTLINAGQARPAEDFARAWLKAHPGDVDLRFQLGDVAHLQGAWAVAEDHYRAVLAKRADHALAMNNLADTLLRQRKPGALALAEQAVKRLPQDPRTLDTLATALAAERQFDRALVLQKQALATSGNQPPYRLNLARLLIQAGDKAGARSQLAQLTELGESFVGQPEVARLLAATAP